MKRRQHRMYNHWLHPHFAKKKRQQKVVLLLEMAEGGNTPGDVERIPVKGTVDHRIYKSNLRKKLRGLGCKTRNTTLLQNAYPVSVGEIQSGLSQLEQSGLITMKVQYIPPLEAPAG